VIGAGVAGLATAAALRASGHDVIVLEAADRIGGRVKTMQRDGWPIPIELGASWIHDVTASDLVGRASRLGITTAEFAYTEATLDPTKGRVDMDASRRTAKKVIDRAVAWAAGRDSDVSVARAIEESSAVVPADRRGLDWYLDTEVTTEYGLMRARSPRGGASRKDRRATTAS
jgi:phytoene dehydrogenase-like protein